MALLPIAVNGMSVTVKHPTVQATIAITGTPSLRLNADGSAVFLDGTQVTVTNITDPGTGATTPDAGPYIVPLNATATRTKSEGELVLRESDESDTINATPTIPGSPPVASPVSFTVEISDAGQNRSLAQ